MKNSTKKILSMLLAVIMILSVMPMAYAESNTYQAGDIIQFGTYPQSEVKDVAVIEKLNNLAPEWEDWISYGYYSGDKSLGSMVQGDWMKYTDISYNGDKYRGVKFTRYRPYYTYYTTEGIFQDTNGYYTDMTYWFEYEPIQWKILDPDSGLVLCETIIDSQPLNNTIYEDESITDSKKFSCFIDPDFTIFANNYEHSSIRQWLNSDFYNTAFTSEEAKLIAVTTLDNSSWMTLRGDDGYEMLDGNETDDKVFLLSYSDVTNSNYGFDVDRYASDFMRFSSGSDYAKAQGLWSDTSEEYYNNSYWLLRTPSQSMFCSYVNNSGVVACQHSVCTTSIGTRPAVTLNLSALECSHELESTSTPATCTQTGVIFYICNLCGFSYEEEIPTVDHTYTSAVTKEATHLAEGETTFTCECGDSYTEAIEKTTEHTFGATVTAPTCTEKGFTTYTCACGESYTADDVDAKGHSHESAITTPATHLKEGVMTYTCVCGDTYTKSIDKIAEHSFKAVVTAPTCTEKGFTTYTCECGSTYIDNYVSAIEHNDTNNDGKCDDCSTKVEIKNNSDNCSCNCHKSGLMGIIWKLLRFFYKIFKTNKICACGVAHY